MWPIILFLSSLLVISAALPPPNAALDIRESRDGSIKIQSVAMSGSACSSRTASVQLLADGRTFTVIYDKFVVHAGKGTTDNDYQKSCELRVKFTHTAGYAFNVFNTAHRGYANMDRGDTALIDANFGYSEESQEVRTGPTNFVDQRRQLAGRSKYAYFVLERTAILTLLVRIGSAEDEAERPAQERLYKSG